MSGQTTLPVTLSETLMFLKASIDFEMMASVSCTSQDDNGVDIFNDIGHEVFFHRNSLPLLRNK